MSALKRWLIQSAAGTFVMQNAKGLLEGMRMSTVYTSDGPKVGVAIAQPAESPHRRVGGGGVEV